MSTASTVEITATVFSRRVQTRAPVRPFNESPRGAKSPKAIVTPAAQRSRSSANVTTSATSRTCVSVIGRKRQYLAHLVEATAGFDHRKRNRNIDEAS